MEADLSLSARRVARGDPAAFRTIVEHTEKQSYRLAARILGSTADAEDVLQEAYVKAYRALAEGRFDERAGVRTWLRRIVTNACIDALRRRAARPAGDDAALDNGRFDSGLDPESRAALSELGSWLDELPAEQRAALVLCAVEGLTALEAADALGCSEGAVEQRLVRARSTLRRRRGGS